MRVSTTLVLVIGAALGCYHEAAGPTAVGSATISLTATGVSNDLIDRIEVYVTEIAASTNPDADTGVVEWAVIVEPRVTVDLLDVRRGRAAVLGEGLLPVGLYEAVRMSIDGDSSRVRFRDGSAAKVRWPSPGVFALQAPADEPLAVRHAGIEVLIELDVGRSFTTLVADPLHDMLFAPVARAVDVGAAGTAAGSATGVQSFLDSTVIPAVSFPLNSALMEVP